ncbi:hypothetical protein NECAME_12582 [Necator americanus]|uniref:Uncharacterized protein n=1 Tax=Necator americanus TaxID=51031 RepID=W2SZ54_NECAM|nr:hypothetical protein NECAME_12582 [Necator americanus]ETN74995.1 hypothetical protein NECAME_12582 [Necator americanus]
MSNLKLTEPNTGFISVDTTTLPRINPKYVKFDKVVAVGFVGRDVSHIVPENGIPLEIPYNFLDFHVSRIVDAIMGRYKPPPTQRPLTSTVIPTTTSQDVNDNDFTVPALKPIKCVFVGDLFNFEDDVDAYYEESELINKVGHDLFDVYPNVAIGFWAYGHTNISKSPNVALENMRKKYDYFMIDLMDMEYIKTDKPTSTAKQDTTQLPKLNPINMGLERIVAIGFNSTDLNGIIADNGVALSVPYHYLEDDVNLIIDAILGRYKLTTTSDPPTTTTTKKPSDISTPKVPSTTTTTAKKSTTTAKPAPIRHDCLFVGDLYNYGDNVDSYDLEGDLIHKVGHDLFDRSPHSSIGLWAYGYTNFSKSVETSLEKMRGKLDDFVNDLRLMEYFKIQDPLTTVNAIEKLNEAQDPKGRANCLVFFSAK